MDDILKNKTIIKTEEEEEKEKDDDDKEIKNKTSPLVETLLRVFKRNRERRSNDVHNPKLNPIIPPYTTDHVLKTPKGIVSFSHFEFSKMIGPNSKHVILLGDVHTNVHVIDDGQFVLDWIVNTLVKKPEQCIDLFIERKLTDSGPPVPNAGPLGGELRKHEVLIKKFKNLRVHRVDTRLGIINETDGRDLIRHMGSHVQTNSKPRMTLADLYSILIAIIMCHVFSLSIEKLVGQVLFKRWKRIFKYFDLPDKFDNYLHNRPDGKRFTYVANKTRKQLKSSIFAKNELKFFKCLFNASVSGAFDKTLYKYGVSAVTSNYIVVMAVLMDAYCLSRLFRDFTSKGRFREPCSKYMQYCVVYAGECHISVYRDFFKLYFGVGEQILAIDDMTTKRPKLKIPFDMTKL